MGRTIVVVLDEFEQRIAIHLARTRAERDRAAGVVDRKRSSSETAERDGFGAELAFAKLFNVYPDLGLMPRSGGSDCILCGRTVDVKATHRENGDLLAVPSKATAKNGADLYALMVCRWPSFRYVGMTTREKLLRPETLTDLGHGQTFLMGQDELTTGMLTAEEIFGRQT
jgi:hypothetical protein